MEQPIEIQVLRILCLGTLQGPVGEIAKSLLRGYLWRNSLHQALWNALCAIPSENPEILRQLLPAQMTRLGFPDVEWEEIFAPQSVSKGEAIALMRRMVRGG